MAGIFKDLSGTSLPYDARSYMRYDDGTGNIPYYAHQTLNNWNTFAWATGTIRCMPFVISQPRTVKSMSINVTVAAAAGNTARLGIYQDNGNVKPGNILLDAGEVAVNTTGFKTIASLAQTLQVGLYWLAFTPTATITTSVTTPATGLVNFMGQNAAGTAGFTLWNGTFVYTTGTPLPTNFLSLTSTLAGGGCPLVLCQFSS